MWNGEDEQDKKKEIDNSEEEKKEDDENQENKKDDWSILEMYTSLFFNFRIDSTKITLKNMMS